MMDQTPQEKAALRQAMQFMGEAIGEVGHSVPPMEWTPEQALAIATAAVTGFQLGDADEQIPFP